MYCHNYEPIFSRLRLLTLEQRHISADFIFLYIIINQVAVFSNVTHILHFYALPCCLRDYTLFFAGYKELVMVTSAVLISVLMRIDLVVVTPLPYFLSNGLLII